MPLDLPSALILALVLLCAASFFVSVKFYESKEY